MTKKRLDRDLKWGFQGFPYYQMRMDTDDFHGLVSIVKLADGDFFFWEMPKAGKTPVCGKGMLWLQLIPDDKHRVITAKFLPPSATVQGVKYSKSVSLWYVDVIDSWGYDEDRVAFLIDKYLDVIFDIEGDVIIDDRGELDTACKSGELSEERYQRAIAEGNSIISDLCSDTEKTQVWCENILRLAMKRIESNDNIFKKNAETYAEEETMNIEKIAKAAFTVIGKEGSTNDGEGFIGRLWEDANSHFGEIAHLAKKDENGVPLGVWGAMSDFSRSFKPWTNFSEGLYLAGAECEDGAEAPEGWVKWIIPAFEYLRVECEGDSTFPDMIKHLDENGLALAGAVHDFTCPQTGKSYMFFPIKKL